MASALPSIPVTPQECGGCTTGLIVYKTGEEDKSLLLILSTQLGAGRAGRRRVARQTRWYLSFRS